VTKGRKFRTTWISWHPRPNPVLPLIFRILCLLYGSGVIALHRLGIRWPIHRSILGSPEVVPDLVELEVAVPRLTLILR